MPLLLGIETSCDECSASVVDHRPGAGLEVRSLVTHSQVAIHRPYGGVVPEIASRNHLETVNETIDRCLADASVAPAGLDAIAVTNRPGLVGALLVGVAAAKAIAYATGKPLVPVHHLEGHAASVFLQPEAAAKAAYPMLIAIVSGGHTNLHVARAAPELWPPDFLARSLVGRSIDDAAGEAFDKTAKVLGFPYPGGAWIEKAAAGGDPSAFRLPRGLQGRATLDFSFSGLKTAVALQAASLRKSGQLEARLADLCASIQEAIVDALVSKIARATRENGCASVALVGGVSANRRLRARLEAELGPAPLLFPSPEHCTDNAAMIAAAGAFRFRQGHFPRGRDMLLVNAIANPEA